MPFWLTRSGARARQYSSSKIEPLEDPDAAPAVLLGPGDHRPAVGEQGALPGPVGLEALGGVERGEGVGRDVRGQPGPGLGPERLLGGAEGQVHDAGNLPQHLRRCQRRRRSGARGRRLVLDQGPYEEVDHRADDLRLRGTSPTVSKACPPSRTVNNLVGDAGQPEVPGQLL